jgi:DNA-binding NarL/FixJ family response regulator
MVVCAHGDVAEFCEAHEMQILEKYDGSLEDYKGSCPVVVTDQKMSRRKYDTLKCTLFGRGVELVSTEWTDDELILRLLHSQIDNRKKRGGRQIFGYMKSNGRVIEMPEKMATARRIIEMRDSGKTLREIADAVDLSMSTIQTIIRNRDKY